MKKIRCRARARKQDYLVASSLSAMRKAVVIHICESTGSCYP